MKFRNYLFLLIVFIPLILCSCKDEITIPNDDKPGRRDYVWTVDTLSNIALNNCFTKLSGSSLSDLWVIGDGASIEQSIIHYDGQKWSFTNSDPLVLALSILNFGKDSLWFGGQSATFWCYKNSTYTINGQYSLKYFKDISLLDLWTDNVKEVFASGYAEDSLYGKYYGIVMKYENNKWAFINKPEIKNQFISIRRGMQYPARLFILGQETEQYGAHIYEYENSMFKEIYSSTINELSPCMFTLNKNLYFFINNNICVYNSNNFKSKIDLSSCGIVGSHIDGRNLKDLFINVKDGIGHYNGTDVKNIIGIGEGIIIDSIIFDNSVAFLYKNRYNNKYYVIRGELNEK
jgi:hypothetical protein